MKQQIEIRRAHINDATAISKLILSVASFFNSTKDRSIASWFLDTVTPEAIADYIRDTKFNYLVAHAGPVLAGAISIRDFHHVHHLFVASEFQRLGIATLLWHRAKSEALVAGNNSGFFVRSSEYAVPVYERFGFYVTGEKVDKEGIIFIPMHLNISL